MNADKILEFRCGDCRMTLNLPAALADMPITSMRKFFKWADQEHSQNVDSINAFFAYIPTASEKLKDQWDWAGLEFQKNYLDPKYDKGSYIKDQKEREKRRNHNERLIRKVRAAKARYERFQKRIAKLKEIQEQYDF